MNNNVTSRVPTVGMGATASFGSDEYPYTVIQIASPKKIIVQADSSKMSAGGEYFGNQDWTISRNRNGATMTVSLRKNGRWVNAGCGMWTSGNVVLGKRYRREDPSF